MNPNTDSGSAPQVPTITPQPAPVAPPSSNSNRSLIVALIIAGLLFVIAPVALIAYALSSIDTASVPSTSTSSPTQTQPTFDSSKYTDTSQMQECIDAYYQAYPEAKNPEPGTVTLAPDCPGVPR